MRLFLFLIFLTPVCTQSLALLECKKKDTETLLTGVDANTCKITYKKRSISGCQTVGEFFENKNCCVTCKDGKWFSLNGIINGQTNCETAQGIFLQIDKNNKKCCVNENGFERTCTSSADVIQVSEQECGRIKGTAYSPVQSDNPGGDINCCYNCRAKSGFTRAEMNATQCSARSGYSFKVKGIYYCCFR